MKNKVLISISAIVILIVATVAVIIINNQNGGTPTGNRPEETTKSAAFDMEYPDRLCGVPVTGMEENSGMIEVRYGASFCRKSLSDTNTDDDKTAYDESSEQNVNGITVTFKGGDGLIYLAVWHDNNFEYTVFAEEGVAADDMIDYIEATR